MLAAACFLASLLLYVRTLAPSVATLFDDSLEFPLAVHRLAIAHPTGYPLYILLGKLLTLFPWRDVAWRVNLLSALAGAVTVSLVFGVGRELTRRRWPALLGAAALAVSPIFWSQSVIAEVYTLNSTFVAGLLWLALRWAHQPLLPVEPFSLLLVGPKGRPSASAGGEEERLLAKTEMTQGNHLPEPGIDREPPPQGQADLQPAGSSSPVPATLQLRSALRRVLRQLQQAIGWARSSYRRLFPAVPPKARLRLHPRTYALAALLGFGLTHHRTVLLLVPALLLWVYLVERRTLGRAALLGPEHPERRRWLQAAGRPVVLLSACLLVPLLLYLYLPIRGHVGSLDGTYLNTWSGFWRWVTASGYGVFLGQNPLARDLSMGFYAELFWDQFGPVGLALSIVGVIGLARQPRTLALTGLAFVTYVAFGVIYRVPDVEVFCIPAFVVTALWLGAGLDYATDLLSIRGPSLAVRRLLAMCRVLLVLAAILQPLAIAVRSYPEADMSQRWALHDYARYVLERPLAANSLVVGLLGEMTLLRTFQETAGLGAGIETLVADDPAARLEAVKAGVVEGKAVHITRSLPGLEAAFEADAVVGAMDVAGNTEALVEVSAPDGQVPPIPNPTGLEILPGLELLGHTVQEHQSHWQDWARLQLWWRAPKGLAAPFKVSARLLNGAGQVVGAADAEPVAWTYPPTAWRPGEVVADAYEIPVPAGTPPGEYVPLVVVYDPADGAEQGRVELPPVQLEGNAARPPRLSLEASLGCTIYAQFGDVQLLGADLPNPETAYRPGDTLPVTLLWQADGQPGGEWRAVFSLEGEEQLSLGEELLGGDYSSNRWHEGEVVRQWLTLKIPGGTAPGAYRLKMRVLHDGQPVPWGRSILPLGNDLELGSVQVTR